MKKNEEEVKRKDMKTIKAAEEATTRGGEPMVRFKSQRGRGVVQSGVV